MIKQNLITEIENYLKESFDKESKRLKHIYNVKKVAVALAELYNVEVSNVIVASYLHDVTKTLSDEDNIKIAGETYSKDVPRACAHAYAAAMIATKKFNIYDSDIINSIRYHCSGRKEMTDLEKIIFVSDFIEEGRDFVSEELRNLAFENIDLAVLKIMLQTKEYILKNNQSFSELTEEAIQYYQKKLEEMND